MRVLVVVCLFLALSNFVAALLSIVGGGQGPLGISVFVLLGILGGWLYTGVGEEIW